MCYWVIVSDVIMICFYISNFSGFGKDDFKYNVCFKFNKFIF